MSNSINGNGKVSNSINENDKEKLGEILTAITGLSVEEIIEDTLEDVKVTFEVIDAVQSSIRWLFSEKEKAAAASDDMTDPEVLFLYMYGLLAGLMAAASVQYGLEVEFGEPTDPNALSLMEAFVEYHILLGTVETTLSKMLELSEE